MNPATRAQVTTTPTVTGVRQDAPAGVRRASRQASTTLATIQRAATVHHSAGRSAAAVAVAMQQNHERVRVVPTFIPTAEPERQPWSHAVGPIPGPLHCVTIHDRGVA